MSARDNTCIYCGAPGFTVCRRCSWSGSEVVGQPLLPAKDAVPDWQDISTARRDGTKVLGWGMLHAPSWATVEEPTIQITRWDEETGSWYAPAMGSWAPTKWMPLPAPPKEVGL
jgi:hypothetical protein